MVDQKSECSISLVRLNGAYSMLDCTSVRLAGMFYNDQCISRIASFIPSDGTASTRTKSSVLLYANLRAEPELTLGRDSMQVRGQVSMQPR